MEKEKLEKILENHKLWLEGKGGARADLRGANLQWANLQEANLRRADLQRADLDFSCWPLWCGSFNVKTDKKIFNQLIYLFIIFVN